MVHFELRSFDPAVPLIDQVRFELGRVVRRVARIACEQRPVFSAIFLPKFRGTAQLQNGRFRGNFAAKIAVISRSK